MQIVRTGLIATATAGSLDILSAFAFAGLAGRTPISVLTGVAAGPFGAQVKDWGAAAPLTGLLVHFTLMAVMVAVFLVAARAAPAFLERPLVTGTLYGLAIYTVMYWLVLPARWPSIFPQTGLWDVGNALFSHILCVGIPIALVAANGRAPSYAH